MQSSECGLDAGLKASIEGWLTEGGSASTSLIGSAKVSGSSGGALSSVNGGADFTVVMTASEISSLEAFIGGSLFGGLSAELQGGLRACAAGGVSGSLSASMHAGLTAWIAESSCPLSAGLKASMGFWLNGSLGAGVEAVGSLTAFPYATASAAISA